MRTADLALALCLGTRERRDLLLQRLGHRVSAPVAPLVCADSRPERRDCDAPSAS
jgi:hypothetical protein